MTKKKPASCGCALWSTSVTARFSSEKLKKKNTQGKKDSVTKLDEVRWDILCTTVWNRHCQRNGWTPVWYFDTRRPLSGPQIYGPTECSWRKDSVMGILDVSTARWSSDNEVLITTPVNGMKRSPLSLRTYKSTTNKRHLPQKGEKKKGEKNATQKKRAPTQQGLAAGGKLGWMPISARQDLTSFMLNSPVSWLWSDGSHALYRYPFSHLRLQHVTWTFQSMKRIVTRFLPLYAFNSTMDDDMLSELESPRKLEDVPLKTCKI